MALFFLFLGVTPCFGQGALRLSDVDFVVRDYQGNLPASDRDWYYLDALGQVLYAGGGQHPAVEFDARDPGVRRPGPMVKGVVYPLGTGSFVLKISLLNERAEAVTGNFTMVSARLRVPAPNPPTGQTSPEYEYLNLSVPTMPFPVSVGPQGGMQTFTITFSGLPSHVLLGDLEVRYDLPLQDAEGMSGNNGTGAGYEQW